MQWEQQKTGVKKQNGEEEKKKKKEKRQKTKKTRRDVETLSAKERTRESEKAVGTFSSTRPHQSRTEPTLSPRSSLVLKHTTRGW